MPSRSGRCPRKPYPPLSSPPMSASSRIITGPMCLNPTGVSMQATPWCSARRRAIAVVVTDFTTAPRRPRAPSRYSTSNANVRSWSTYAPDPSTSPTRSASPSFAMPASKPPPATSDSSASRFEAIGSGARSPGKSGLRSVWISSTCVLPPSSSAGRSPAPAPYIGSTATRSPAPRMRSRSTCRASPARYPGIGSKRAIASESAGASFGLAGSARMAGTRRSMSSTISGLALPP